MNDDEGAIARRKIELYRRYLAEGAEPELSRIYLMEIAKLHALLDEIERHGGPQKT
jgi:hypothetical protein